MVVSGLVVLGIEPSAWLRLGEYADMRYIPALLIVFCVKGIIWLSVRPEKRRDSFMVLFLFALRPIDQKLMLAS